MRNQFLMQNFRLASTIVGMLLASGYTCDKGDDRTEASPNCGSQTARECPKNSTTYSAGKGIFNPAIHSVKGSYSN